MEPTGKTIFVSEQHKPLHRSTVNFFSTLAVGQPQA